MKKIALFGAGLAAVVAAAFATPATAAAFRTASPGVISPSGYGGSPGVISPSGYGGEPGAVTPPGYGVPGVVPTSAHLAVVAKHLRDLRGVLVGPGGVAFVIAGTAKIYKVVPGHAPTVYAGAFVHIVGIALDRGGNLYVLEGGPVGALIKVAPNGHRTEIAVGQLHNPGGVGLGLDGSIYVSVNATSPTDAELVKVTP